MIGSSTWIAPRFTARRDPLVQGMGTHMRTNHILWIGMLAWMTGCGGTVDESDGDAAGAGGSSGTGGQTGGTGGTVQTGGSAGVGGEGASAGTGGTSGGSAGTAGSAGEAGQGGAGAAGEAGSGGAAGSGGSKTACTDASQCTIFSDCCSCIALGPGDPAPEPCPAMCATDKCTELGVDPNQQPECQAGQCVVGFDCDSSKAVCAMPPPSCPPGHVPSVPGGCWGPCVPATECSFVPDCDHCDPSSQLCVKYSAWTVESHCVPIPPECKDDLSCDCMGADVCVDPFNLCFDDPSQGSLSCECPAC